MIYLVRHAQAEDGVADAERELTGKGRDQARRLAALLKRTGPEPPAAIWHSPLVRARQTAEIVAEGLKWSAPLSTVAGFLPDDRPELAAKRLAGEHAVAVFGHNPHLTLLGTLLVTGRPAPAAFHFRKCSALALETCGGKPGTWLVHWFIEPELLD